MLYNHHDFSVGSLNYRLPLPTPRLTADKCLAGAPRGILSPGGSAIRTKYMDRSNTSRLTPAQVKTIRLVYLYSIYHV